MEESERLSPRLRSLPSRMDDVVIRPIENVELKDPVLVEGLPGVGNVGKLAADYLKDKVGARPLATIFSKFFPPQVYVSEDGVIRLVSNGLYYRKGKSKGERDLLILGGDYQGISPEGQYELTHRVLEVAARFGAKEVYTLAGFAQGHVVESPRGLGALPRPRAALRDGGGLPDGRDERILRRPAERRGRPEGAGPGAQRPPR